MEVEEVKYGMLMMVLCDREGRIYDVGISFGRRHIEKLIELSREVEIMDWISFGSMHEVRAFRDR